MQAIVLLSGGLDCGMNLAIAAANKSVKLALTVNYGQRAYEAEAKAARALATYFQVEWRELDLRWLGEIHANGLTRSSAPLPNLQASELDSPELTEKSMRAVWVANRNGVLINAAAAFAEAMGADTILTGFNREEAASFPDNSVEYLAAATKALSFSTLNQVSVDAFTKNWDKTQIVAEGIKREFPFNLLWSCYTAGPKRCWECESCKRTERAFLQNGSAGRAWLTKMDYSR
jgi:7-cyano-7-deazaguanine synthase